MSACILLARLWLGTLSTNLQVWLDRSKCGLGRDCQKDMVAWACHCLPSILCCVFPLATEGSWMHLLPWGPMDLVVSNPPYVFHRDMEELAPEILRCGGRVEQGARPEKPRGRVCPGGHREGWWGLERAEVF